MLKHGLDGSINRTSTPEIKWFLFTLKDELAVLGFGLELLAKINSGQAV